MDSPITLAIVGSCLALVGTLIVLNLRSIKKCVSSFGGRIDKQDDQIVKQNDRIEKQNEKIISLTTTQANCKRDCDRNFVDKEDWLREAGFSRDKLDIVTNTLSRLEGKLVVIEKMPEICGQIAAEVASKIKGPNHD